MALAMSPFLFANGFGVSILGAERGFKNIIARSSTKTVKHEHLPHR